MNNIRIFCIAVLLSCCHPSLVLFIVSPETQQNLIPPPPPLPCPPPPPPCPPPPHPPSPHPSVHFLLRRVSVPPLNKIYEILTKPNVFHPPDLNCCPQSHNTNNMSEVT